MAGRELPSSIESEQQVVGGCLLDPRAVARVVDLVQPIDFYHPTTGAIFEAILALDKAGKPVDLVSVAAQMRALDSFVKLRAVGGELYFSELMSAVVTVENIQFHAGVVRGKATARRIVEAAQEIAARGYSELDADDYIAQAERSIVDIAQARQVRPEAVKVHDLLGGVIQRVEARSERRTAVTGVPTGFHKLDAMTAGLQPGDLVIIAARPSQGKTSLAMNAAQNAAIEHRCPVLVFSLEMSKESLVERLLCSEARVDATRLRVGDLESQRDWINITKAASRIAEAPIWIDDVASPTLLEIRARARRWWAMVAASRPRPPCPRCRATERCRPEHGELDASGQHHERSKVELPPGLVVVDYLQLVAGATREKGERGERSREREISEISRGLKALAKELRCPVVALSQLNRNLESRGDKRPQLSDLRESGALEQDADVIAFIYRDEVYNKQSEDKGVAEIIIGKQRNGPIGTVRLAFLNQYTRFENLAEIPDETGDGGALQ